jgi:Flp pilus assembly pilin Flp
MSFLFSQEIGGHMTYKSARKLATTRQGASGPEYGILLAGISVLGIASVMLFGMNTKESLDETTTQLGDYTDGVAQEDETVEFFTVELSQTDEHHFVYASEDVVAGGFGVLLDQSETYPVTGFFGSGEAEGGVAMVGAVFSASVDSLLSDKVLSCSGSESFNLDFSDFDEVSYYEGLGYQTSWDFEDGVNISDGSQITCYILDQDALN